MASRIPIRRGRTAGAENENVNIRESQLPSRAKVTGRAGVAGSSKTGGSSTDMVVAYSKTEREAEASAKRKREALRELTELRNRGGKGKNPQGRKILGLPKKSTAVARESADENTRPPVFVAPPATRVSAHRRSSSSRSLIPVLQREEEIDEDEPMSKRPRTSSVEPEEVAAELAVYTDDEAEAEADPDSDLWDDLDAADFDDPAMASEYVVDIQHYLKESELNTMPNPNYMDSQPKLMWEMRGLLNEWLMQVHTRFRLTAETLFLCTNLTDRFLSARIVSPSKLQLVGMACLLIASKFEETVSPAIANFIAVAEGTYTPADMRQAEQHILRALDWDLSYPNPLHFLRRISKADGFEVKTRTLAKYLVEIACVEHALIAAPPTKLAAAAMWLARIALGEEVWTPNLAHYAMYAESALLPVAEDMLRYVLQPIAHEAFYKKWAGKRNMKVSIYMRHWALARWAEGARVDLRADLPALRRAIRAQAVRDASLSEDGGASEVDLDEE
ncbi:cyclin-like protein [Mycena maculata]|uniref:Cyclin-like protein n=1 Tax=Mycena maculata TaxID=230809 RepID=A0AAD7NBJ9_9AGAR|nr:cyclin-like protein [Mycena maculata]